MADSSQPTNAPQSSTTSPSNPHTPRATSIPDDSSTEYEPTPVHSPGVGPQYEDLPPSYDFALSDTRNGGTALDASQIEAHRVSANEGPNEPEVWEYRMRGESAEDAQVHEEAPAYDGHVPVQHVTSSQNIPVGQVGDFNSSTTPMATRGASAADDQPHSILRTPGGHRAQAWGPFGPPGNGPFGPPGNGPFGARGNGAFGSGRSFTGDSGNFRGRGRRGRGSRSSQDWTAFGQNMGRWGEEFGRRMGNWGEQFGRQAGAMGKQFGQRTEQWASAYSAGGGGYNPPTRPNPTAGPSTAEPSGPPQYDHPPSYEAPVGIPGQETGVYRNLGPNEYPPEKVPQSPSEKPSVKSLEKQKSKDYDDDDDDDDDSSISSGSSDSSSSSVSEDDFDDIQAKYLSRIDAIHKDAESALSTGKKSREEIEHERDLAIAKAIREKEVDEYVFGKRSARRTQKRMFRDRKRELTRDYRQRKRELRDKSESNGKGKGKAKKGSDWKELKKDYKAKRRALKRERTDAKKSWKGERREMKKGPPEWLISGAPEQKVLKGKGRAPEST
ncbi:hypothetical protein E8E12_008370 [Didymella heteroderae]|uniref:Uncharacterized protein n=1 Tax=Didymella heteroderae TaxID=1769908 RepID=A0A9P4WSY7_9PLEO|nr:hypothetical protein E8E12_008370 [Didymella heteroderae]